MHVDAVDVTAAHEAARLARTAGALVTCDIDTVDGGTAALVEAVSHPILAEHVPAALTGETDVERAVQALGQRHAGPICVTLGARGAVLLAEGRLHRVAGRPVDAVDTTGAGDVFVARSSTRCSRGGRRSTSCGSPLPRRPSAAPARVPWAGFRPARKWTRYCFRNRKPSGGTVSASECAMPVGRHGLGRRAAGVARCCCRRRARRRC